MPCTFEKLCNEGNNPNIFSSVSCVPVSPYVTLLICSFFTLLQATSPVKFKCSNSNVLSWLLLLNIFSNICVEQGIYWNVIFLRFSADICSNVFLIYVCRHCSLLKITVSPSLLYPSIS